MALIYGESEGEREREIEGIVWLMVCLYASLRSDWNGTGIVICAFMYVSYIYICIHTSYPQLWITYKIDTKVNYELV